MRDRVADKFLSELADFPYELRLSGPAVPAHVVDLAERGVVTIRRHDGKLTATLNDPAAMDEPVDAAVLRLMFPAGYGSEAVLSGGRFAGQADALEKAVRRRTRAAGLWRTTVSGRMLLRALAILITGGLVQWLLAELVQRGAPTWIGVVVGLPVSLVTLFLTAVTVRTAVGRVLTPAGMAAADQVRAYVAECRTDPDAGLGDLIALGRAADRVDDDTDRPVRADMVPQIGSAFRYAATGPEISGGGGGS